MIITFVVFIFIGKSGGGAGLAGVNKYHSQGSDTLIWARLVN